MTSDSSTDLRNQKPLRIATESDVVEAFASAGSRGEVAVLERFTPHMMHGSLTKGALFQLAFHVDDAYVHADRGLLYSAILLHAAILVLGGDTRSWAEFRTRPGILGEFISILAGPEGRVVAEDRKPIRNIRVVLPRHEVEAPIHDVLDIVLTRLHLSFDTLTFLHDHLQDAGMKGLVKSLLLMNKKELCPG
ncbi:MAG: hypothetical protein KBD06_02780 [Candidatus Pacebacteria bacterium]|nr:hypothetical protein [Candidatus Paceibacterota bacterium]